MTLRHPSVRSVVVQAALVGVVGVVLVLAGLGATAESVAAVVGMVLISAAGTVLMCEWSESRKG